MLTIFNNTVFEKKSEADAIGKQLGFDLSDGRVQVHYSGINDQQAEFQFVYIKKGVDIPFGTVASIDTHSLFAEITFSLDELKMTGKVMEEVLSKLEQFSAEVEFGELSLQFEKGAFFPATLFYGAIMEAQVALVVSDDAISYTLNSLADMGVIAGGNRR